MNGLSQNLVWKKLVSLHQKKYNGLMIRCLVFHLFLMVLCSCNSQTFTKMNLKNRKSVFAGRFYENNPESLKLELNENFSYVKFRQKLNPLAIIAPHAGYAFSGQTAAEAFYQINENAQYENIFIIAPSHHVLSNGAAIFNSGDFETPLGVVSVNHELCSSLLDKYPTFFHEDDSAHEKEHALEVELPFLQIRLKKSFKIVPILITSDNLDECKEIARVLLPFYNEKNLFVISTDLSHYPTYNDAKRIDGETIETVLGNNADSLQALLNNKDKNRVDNLYTRLCGKYPVFVLLYLNQLKGNCSFQLLKYINSGDSPYGDKSRVVGYAAFAVKHKPDDSIVFDAADKKELLTLARNTLNDYLKTGQVPEYSTKNNLLEMKMGAFVSLYKNGDLRGCIGTFTGDKPLLKTVQEMVVASATHDHRFEPVDSTELNEIKIEISVLTPLKKIQDTSEIVLGKHGVYIKKGTYTGTFLPQVYNKTGWVLEDFLGHCSRDKAGIGWDGWKTAEIYTYEAIVFAE